MKRDLALLKTNSKGKPVSFFNGQIKQGAMVEALGHPKGRKFSLTKGWVSAIRKESSVYNVGSGESYSVGQVIDLVVDILNKPIKVQASGVRRESEVMDCYADIRKLVKDFDWIKKYSLRSGLADYIDEIK